MPTIEQNYKVWNSDHAWAKDGDEWSDQAAYCGQPYERWKAALIEHLMLPYISGDSHVLEIGPGHGRWTKLYVNKVKHVGLVDLSPSCIERCKQMFHSFDHIDYFVNDGTTLRFISDETIDFVWSYDVFVHIERAETKRYIAEFARVLRDGGTAVIHHPNSHRALLSAKALLVNASGPLRKTITKQIFRRYGNMGRSLMSGETIKKLAKGTGLQPILQTDTWGARKEYNCRRFGDQISVLKKNHRCNL
jgi:ubiquinone/menaquinone biosynthesis C-methylase UbiE